jgi:hypothetical protein
MSFLYVFVVPFINNIIKMQQQQPNSQTYQQKQQQYQSKHDFQNPYFRFMYAIKSPETKKRYPDRFKAFLDYIQIPGTNIEERLVNFYNQANQNLPWLRIIQFM